MQYETSFYVCLLSISALHSVIENEVFMCGGARNRIYVSFCICTYITALKLFFRTRGENKGENKDLFDVNFFFDRHYTRNSAHNAPSLQKAVNGTSSVL